MKKNILFIISKHTVMAEKLEKYLIQEYNEFKISLTPELITEAIEKGKPVIMTGILQKANTLNRNGRVYPLDILKRESKNYMELVEKNLATGELDHPETAVVSLQNVSHKVVDMWWQDDELHGKVQITKSTPAGKTLLGLIQDGVTLGISSRGVGSVKRQGDQDIVQNDFELIAFDFVSSPSTPGAFMFKEGRQIGLTPLSEATQKQVEKNYNQKLDYLAKKDFWKNL
jgi:hypothetical protein